MNANPKYLKRSLMVLGFLHLTAAIIGMLLSAWVQPVQAAPKKPRTPTRTPTPIYTSTPASVPYATPNPGPTITVDGIWKIVSSPNAGTGTHGNRLNAVAVVSANNVWAVGWYQSGSTDQEGGALTMHWVVTPETVVRNPSWSTPFGVTALSSNDV